MTAFDGEILPWVKPDSDKLRAVWYVCIFCAILSFLISLKEYVLHKKYENHPKIQHYMERLLLTMPVYGITAAGSVLFPLCTVQFILIRQCFQAYMVYNFVELLIAYFTPYATEEVRIKNLAAICKHLDTVRAAPPCCCMGELHPNKHWLHDQVLVPVRTFAIVIPLFAIIGMLFDAYNNYGFGVQDPERSWFWLNLLSVLFTMWALSGLFTVYQVLGPLLKGETKLQNTCVHIVLGPMVLQELLIGILGQNGVIGLLFDLNNEPQSAMTLLNLLFCIESVLVGFLFSCAFSARPFYEIDSRDTRFTHEHHEVVQRVNAEHGEHFARGHKMPALLRRLSLRNAHDAANVSFTNAQALADAQARPRRDTVDKSSLSLRHHDAKPSV